ncbi:hypothetical protein KL921_003356 [Ogataea angusta]|nr:hypothetical protein KL921_003356 [Ogataea angusta]
MTTDNSQTHQLVLSSFRCLIADLVQHYGGGHPGGAMGMAAMGVALWKYAMNYSPSNPDFFNRDRFVLSNGHTCLFQYVFLHLSGYKHMTMEQLKTYHSDRPDSFCPGHPEIEHPGIEVTTGPLGQGIANAVGLSIASKNLAATYNRPGYDVVDNSIFCIVGDACLQEGVGLEAISLAGHLGLGNLIVLYDNNQVTCDGSADVANTEDVAAKFRACEWAVLDVVNGSEDVEAIVGAIDRAKQISDRPVLINVHTVIGYGALNQGQASAHGAALGEDNVRQLKVKNGLDPDLRFHVPQEVYEFFSDCVPRGQHSERAWQEKVAKYTEQYPELAAEFARRVAGKLPSDWKKHIPTEFPSGPTPTRKSSGLVFAPLAKAIDSIIAGTADLTPSVHVSWPGARDFQKPQLQTSCGLGGDYSGRYIHYGIREHAMAAIANGLAAYNRGTFVPVTSTFFMFYLYAAPAVRMGALQELQTIHVATHDSIGTGEDGPTHQPIALPAFYRALPNTLYLRPADSEETAGAWEAAMDFKHGPSLISLSRQALPQLGVTSRDKVALGAYVVKPETKPQLQLLATGSDLQLALKAAEKLAGRGIRTRVVSFPCTQLFERQSTEYKQSVLLRGEIPSVVVESYAVNGWERYATAGYSMHTFGKSLPGQAAYEYFGFSPDRVADRVENYFRSATPEKLWYFEDLN